MQRSERQAVAHPVSTYREACAQTRLASLSMASWLTTVPKQGSRMTLRHMWEGKGLLPISVHVQLIILEQAFTELGALETITC